MTKIKKITVQNLKAIKDLSIDFSGASAIITAGNNKGKSSFLRSLPERLAGANIEILKQGEKEGFAEWELTTGEKFIWTFGKKDDEFKEKLQFITDRNIKMGITKEISNAYFPERFDVDKFLNSTPAAQRKILENLIGLDLSELDQKYKNAYDERTIANRQLKDDTARVLPVDEQLPKESISIQLEQKRQEISDVDVHNLKVQNIADKIKEKAILINDNQESIENNDSEIASLKLKIEELENRNFNLSGQISGLQEEIKKGNEWLKVDKNQPKDKRALQADLSTLVETEEKIVQNNKAIELQEKFIESKAYAEKCDRDVKDIIKEKEALISKSKMPEGFSFSEEGEIQYNGFALSKDQLSSSSIYIAALKLAHLGLGEVKSIHFDASFLDRNSLDDIEKWAVENDLQLLIERPDFEGGEIEYQIIEK